MQKPTETAARRAPYPSDLSDRQWRAVEPLIPPEKDRGRHRSTDIREVVNGINYRWSTGCVWRMLPHDFPPWGTVYTYFRRWQEDGTLRALRKALLRPRSRGQKGAGRGSENGRRPESPGGETGRPCAPAEAAADVAA